MIVAVAMMRDEADIAEYVVRRLLAEGVDRVIVADNLSVDGTGELLRSIGDAVTVVDDPEVAYYQSEKVTRLAHLAGDMGADWVIPFDADELWYSPHGTLSAALACAVAPVQRAITFEHVPTDSDSDDPNPLRRIRHRRPDPKPFMKVAFRYHPSARVWQGNHDVDHPGPAGQSVLEIREFQYRSLEQTARKVRTGRAAYEATNLAASEGSHWRQMGAWSDGELETWWKDYTSQPVVLDPAPVR